MIELIELVIFWSGLGGLDLCFQRLVQMVGSSFSRLHGRASDLSLISTKAVGTAPLILFS